MIGHVSDVNGEDGISISMKNELSEVPMLAEIPFQNALNMVGVTVLLQW